MDKTENTHPPFCFRVPITNLVGFLALAVNTDDAAVSPEPVKLPQHLHGLVAVFIRQIKELRQQVQVLNGDGFCCEQGVLVRPRHKHILRIE